MKNVSSMATMEWYIPEEDWWQVVGFATPTEASLWVVDKTYKYKADRFRSRVFVVQNDNLAEFLEQNNVTDYV